MILESTLIGSLLGGIFRVVPEVLKTLDRASERKHELQMQDRAFEFQKLANTQRIEEINTQGQQDWNKGSLEVLKEAIAGQEAPSGIKWVDGFSKLMRPLITFQWVIILYPAVIVANFLVLVQSNVPLLQALPMVFGEPEKGIVSAIMSFWFLGRVFDKAK